VDNGSAGFDKINIGDMASGVGTIANSYFSEVQFVKNQYFNAGNLDHINTVKNIANFMGLFETMLGYKWFDTDTNVITNPSMTTSTNWTAGTGWSHDAGNGEFDHTGGGGAGYLTVTTPPLVSGTRYICVFKVKNMTAGSVRFETTGAKQGFDHAENGTFWEEFTADATGFRFYAISSFNGSIDDVYVYEGSFNNNITFPGTTETIEYKDEFNMVQWSDINKLNIPDLYFKRVTEPVVKTMPAPSFLGFDYINTFLIFTRNTINRFVLEGTASGWAADSKTLIKEIVQYGLLAKRSLVVTGQSVLWMSEVGVIKWDSQGFSTISHKRFDIPPLTTYRGVYVPNMNQYWLTVDGTTVYVYDLTLDIWLGTFTNLDIDDIIVYSGGGTIMDGNLLLNSSGGIGKIPGSIRYIRNPIYYHKRFFYVRRGCI